jgi:hypothetical protein
MDTDLQEKTENGESIFLCSLYFSLDSIRHRPANRQDRQATLPSSAYAALLCLCGNRTIEEKGPNAVFNDQS